MLANGNTTTTVAHYKDAAKRHFRTCEILIKQLDSPQNFRDRDKWHDIDILANIYYLTGYMAECGINYTYLIKKSFVDADNHLDRNNWGSGVDLHKHFRFTINIARTSSRAVLTEITTGNNACTLPLYLQKLSGVTNINLTSTDATLEDMQAKWDPSVRYSYESTGLIFDVNTSKNDIILFYKATKKLLKDFRLI